LSGTGGMKTLAAPEDAPGGLTERLAANAVNQPRGSNRTADAIDMSTEVTFGSGAWIYPCATPPDRLTFFAPKL